VLTLQKLATHSMLLLPGSLPTDHATLKALCAGLKESADIAARLLRASVEPFAGSWSDAEREALALTGDLCDGQALAATASSEKQYAVATPLHAALGLTDVTPLDPALIALTEHESHLLCEAANQHLSVDGIRLSFVDADTWLVTCATEMSVVTERPEWLIGEPLRPNLPRGKDARLLERWMNELQMLLFAHPMNAAREARGLPLINVVWLWGFGARTNDEIGTVGAALPRPLSNIGNAGRGRAAPTKSLPHLEHLHALRNGNVPAWQDAWQTRSSEILSADSIILGDSRPRLRITPRKASTATKFTALFQRKPTLADALVALQEKL
jgi:hypothetical protein